MKSPSLRERIEHVKRLVECGDDVAKMLSELRLLDYQEGKAAAQLSAQLPAVLANANSCREFDNKCVSSITFCYGRREE